MKHPWQEVPLSDYEHHMSLSSIAQLQCLHEGMIQQLAYPVDSVMILGIAGGNGLDLFEHSSIQTIYGVDINETYLCACKERYPNLKERFHPLCLDITTQYLTLPKAELIIANLLIEYIGYVAFLNVVKQCEATIVSCMIQCNLNQEFVSVSPYEESFVRLHEVHHDISKEGLRQAMESLSYTLCKEQRYPLPNGKALLQLDFKKSK